MTDMLSTGYVQRRNAGESFANIFHNGVIEIWSGLQPATADHAPTGSLLAKITRGGGLWVAGSPSNGLQFAAAGRYVTKHPDHLWRMVGQATGVAGWYRLLPNQADPGTLSITAARIDGAIGLIDVPGNFQMFMPDLAVTAVLNVAVPHYWRGTPPLPTE